MYSIQGSRLPSNAVFKVTHPSPATLNQIVDKITMLTELMTIAEASCKFSGQNDNELEVSYVNSGQGRMSQGDRGL